VLFYMMIDMRDVMVSGRHFNKLSIIIIILMVLSASLLKNTRKFVRAWKN